MKDISEIADAILKDVSGSIRTAREKAVVEAISAFAKRSGVFDFTTEHTVTSADVDAYTNNSVTLYPNDTFDFHPWRVEKLWIDGVEKKIHQRAILSKITDFDAIYGTGTLFYNVDATGAVILFPFPATAFAASSTGILAIVIKAAHVPDSAITEIDEFFYARWGTVIEAGAKALMMIETDKPWSNPDRAKTFAAAFDAGMNAALMKTRLAEAGGELNVEKIPFI